MGERTKERGDREKKGWNNRSFQDTERERERETERERVTNCERVRESWLDHKHAA
jgi:hypothetical protein